MVLLTANWVMTGACESESSFLQDRSARDIANREKINLIDNDLRKSKAPNTQEMCRGAFKFN